MQFVMSEIRYKQKNEEGCVIIINTSLKITYNFQGIHHDIVNLWKCVYSIIHYWHHPNGNPSTWIVDL